MTNQRNEIEILCHFRFLVLQPIANQWHKQKKNKINNEEKDGKIEIKLRIFLNNQTEIQSAKLKRTRKSFQNSE